MKEGISLCCDVMKTKHILGSVRASLSSSYVRQIRWSTLALPNDLGLMWTRMLLVVVLWESMLRLLLSRDSLATSEMEPAPSATSAAAKPWRCLSVRRC